MHRSTLIGIGLFLIGMTGYAVGIHVAYPGRAFSVSAVMTGVAIAAIGQQSAARGDG